MTKRETVYGRYRALIAGGTLAPGERLPSIRAEAAASGCSVNTVVGAYGRLADEGWIRARERGGFTVRRRAASLEAGTEAPPLPEHFVSEAREAGERLDLIFERLLRRDSLFAVASPGADLLPVDRLSQSLGRLKRSWVEYADPAGDREFRRRIALALEPSSGPAAAEDIVVTNGATEALALVFRAFLHPGDTVVLESPTYFNYFRQLAPLGVEILEVPVGHGGIDLDILESLLDERPIRAAVVQPNVQNPTGTTMDDHAKARLAALAERHRFILIQDDVYGDLHFGPERPKNLSAFSDYEDLVLVSSYSKSIAPGLRTGFAVSAAHSGRLTEEKLRASFESSRPAQFALSDFIASAAHRRHLAALRSALERRIDDHIAYLEDLLPPGSSLRRPSGGCLLWIAFPPGTDATSLFEGAARRGLVAAPGELFSAGPRFRGHLRINAGHRLTSERKAALRALAAHPYS